MRIVTLFLLVFLLAGTVAARTRYERIDTSNFVNRADIYEGRLVTVTAEVLAINADGKSIRLFDAESKALIDVKLTQLNKAQRRSLMLNPVRRISVYGRATVKDGRLIIDAHRAVPQKLEAGGQKLEVS
jgi:hypothetical protein